MSSLRVATWNVHGAVGMDLRRSVDRVADVVRELGVDVALLQELDVARARSGRIDQPAAIALRLGWGHAFGAAVRDGETAYGNAIVSRHALEGVRTVTLPTRLGAEPRAATRAEIDTPIGRLEVVVTHLGLTRHDRVRQAARLATLLGPAAWPRVVGGDLNARADDAALRALAEGLAHARGGPTFPALYPLLALDHVLVDRRLRIVDVVVPRLRTIRLASDHLPVVVTLERMAGAEAA